MNGPDYIVDIGNSGAAGSSDGAASRRESRPWLSVMWECCQTYSRVYRNRAGTAYVGHCPRCGKRIQVKIGPGGTSHRLFKAW